MGGFFDKALSKIQTNKEQRLLMVGLDAAGKTTILYKLHLGEIVTTIPTIGFNLETMQYKNIVFTVWDVGGKDKIRPLWRHLYQNAAGLIYVVDSNDRERIDDEYGADNSSKEHLNEMLAEEELACVPLLVFANKQDLPNAMSVNEVTDRLGLNQLRNRQWYIQASCATTGDGLYEGLDWLSATMKKYGPQLEKMRAKWKKEREKELAKQRHEQAKREEDRRQKIESQQKSILLVSGYVREFYEFEAKQQMMTFIPASVTQYVHVMYHDPYYHCDRSWKYYGEYTLSRDTQFDASNLNVEQQVILNQFLDRMEDPDHIHEDEQFLQRYIEKKGRLNDGSKEADIDPESVEKWNHYDFLRFLWYSFCKYQRVRDEEEVKEDDKTKGKTIRQLGMKDIWANTPYSTTRTYFWAQMVFYGLAVDVSHKKLSTYNFNYFLVQNPALSNNYKELMNNYYSQKLRKEMKSEERKNEMILPDIMELPSLITNVEKMKKEQQDDEYLKSNTEQYQKKEISDDEFLIQFETRSYKSWNNHLSFLRVIWCYLNNGGMNEQNMRTKWKLFAKENYHESKTNFWIQMVKHYQAKYKHYIDNKDKEQVKAVKYDENLSDDVVTELKKMKQTMDTWSFAGFVLFCEWKEIQIENTELYLEYYKAETMESANAAQQIVEPDVKPLPK